MNVNDVFIELMKEKQLPDLVVQDYWGTITLQKQMKHSNSLALVGWSILYSMPNTELAVLLTSKKCSSCFYASLKRAFVAL